MPDYLVDDNNRLVQLFGEADSIQLDTLRPIRKTENRCTRAGFSRFRGEQGAALALIIT